MFRVPFYIRRFAYSRKLFLFLDGVTPNTEKSLLAIAIAAIACTDWPTTLLEIFIRSRPLNFFVCGSEIPRLPRELR